jgi:diaminohydroxyphosphoribosylaminopyrimidine deaminase / 5-amino-6-(5-phosphoribosylamino)uracil reductase
MSLDINLTSWLTQQSQQPLTARPFVTLSYAQSLDGSIALRVGTKCTISGQQASVLTHQLRSWHDGILVGIGTVLSDDPQLNVRHCLGKNPQPIVLDSHFRIPPRARLRRNKKKCWVASCQIPAFDADLNGVEIIHTPHNSEGQVCLPSLLASLHAKGIRRLMVEGGAEVIRAFLRAKLVDAVVITISPLYLGGYKSLNNLDLPAEQLPKIAPLHSQCLGSDIIVWGAAEFAQDAIPNSLRVAL